jgi:hypothetical protein
MQFVAQSQVDITPAARAKLMADMHSFGEEMVTALCWIHRSYVSSPEGQTYNEKFEYFGWGGIKSDGINPEFFGRSKVQNLPYLTRGGM